MLSVGNRAKATQAVVGTDGYLGAEQYALARYEDGQAAITERSVGTGKAYAVGIDLGSYMLQGYNNREDGGGAQLRQWLRAVDRRAAALAAQSLSPARAMP